MKLIGIAGAVGFKPKLRPSQIFNPSNTEHRVKIAVKFSIEGGNVVAQSKLGFYNLRNKSPTHLWRPVTEPPNDPPVVPLPLTRWLEDW